MFFSIPKARFTLVSLDFVCSGTNNPLRFSNHFIVTKSRIARKGFAGDLLRSHISTVDAEGVYSQQFIAPSTQRDMHEAVIGTPEGTLLWSIIMGRYGFFGVLG